MDTPDVEPEVPIEVVGTQATPIVVQGVTAVTIAGVRRRRPPVPVPRTVDGTTAVAATGNGGTAVKEG